MFLRVVCGLVLIAGLVYGSANETQNMTALGNYTFYKLSNLILSFVSFKEETHDHKAQVDVRMNNETLAINETKLEVRMDNKIKAINETKTEEATNKTHEQTNERKVPADSSNKAKEVPSDKNTQGIDNASFKQSASIVSIAISCLLASLIF